MEWPVRFSRGDERRDFLGAFLRSGHAVELLESLADERVWEHLSRAIPADAATLDAVIRSRLAGGYRATFTVRQHGRAVGITSVLFDPNHPAGAEIGGTLLDPGRMGDGCQYRGQAAAARGALPPRRRMGPAAHRRTERTFGCRDPEARRDRARHPPGAPRSPGRHTPAKPDLPHRAARTVDAGMMTRTRQHP
jgi:hypothetical protein